MKIDLRALQITPKRLVAPESWLKHLPFAFFIMQYFKPSICVELGVHTGNSFCAFAEASNIFNTNSKLYGVDTFEGEVHAGIYDESVYTELSHYVKMNFNENVSLMKMRFEEAVTYFSDGSINLLHIDGLHTYEAVKNDYDTWLPKMQKNGIILFHDTLVRRDEFGVWKFWEEIKDKHNYAYEFKFGHGLGVLALGPSDFVSMLSTLEKEIGLDELFLPAGERNEWLYNYRIMKNDLEMEKESHRQTQAIFSQFRDIDMVAIAKERNDLQFVLNDLKKRRSFQIYSLPFAIWSKIKKFTGLNT